MLVAEMIVIFLVVLNPTLYFQDTGVSGCGTIVVSGESLYLNNSDYSVWSSRLKVDANFTEAATGKFNQHHVHT